MSIEGIAPEFTDRYFAQAGGTFIGMFRAPGAAIAQMLPAGAVEVPGPPSDATLERWDGMQWVPILAEMKRRRRAEVDAKLLDMGENGIPYGGKLLQLREADQQNIIGMSAAAMLAQSGVIPWPADFAWRMRDNTYLPMPTAADMIALAAFAMQTVKNLRFVAFGHKDAIDEMETAAEVDAYDIEQGW